MLHSQFPFYNHGVYGYVIQSILNFAASASPDGWAFAVMFAQVAAFMGCFGFFLPTIASRLTPLN
ncbi:hypothetical protein X734_05590 [Mesorhizobium sp. L2C084A000]|nr:hypothetical protein X734_05590 [Mesorhizobium sp. L2C084A000]